MMRAILLLFGACTLAAAQIGRVDAVVTGRDGRRLTGLKPENFEVLQDGKPRKIAEFSYVDEEPERTLVVLVDDLSLELTDFLNVRQALGMRSSYSTPRTLPG